MNLRMYSDNLDSLEDTVLPELKNRTVHLLVSLLLTITMLGLALLPPEVVAALGCRNRGLWALAIGLGSGLTGVFMAVGAVVEKMRGRPSGWLAVCSLAYSLPLLLLIIFA